MTYEESLELTQKSLEEGRMVLEALSYDYLYAVEEALEKQIPKKPTKSVKMELFVCPNCETFLHADKLYCSRCGQAIDWSEIK